MEALQKGKTNEDLHCKNKSIKKHFFKYYFDCILLTKINKIMSNDLEQTMWGKLIVLKKKCFQVKLRLLQVKLRVFTVYLLSVIVL